MFEIELIINKIDQELIIKDCFSTIKIKDLTIELDQILKIDKMEIIE